MAQRKQFTKETGKYFVIYGYKTTVKNMWDIAVFRGKCMDLIIKKIKGSKPI